MAFLLLSNTGDLCVNSGSPSGSLKIAPVWLPGLVGVMSLANLGRLQLYEEGFTVLVFRFSSTIATTLFVHGWLYHRCHRGRLLISLAIFAECPGNQTICTNTQPPNIALKSTTSLHPLRNGCFKFFTSA